MRSIVAVLVLISVSSGAFGEVVIERFAEPIDLAAVQSPDESAADVLSLVTKEVHPDDDVWFIPYFDVDTTASAFGSSTFWSIRNEGDLGANALIAVEYFDSHFVLQDGENVGLIPNQVVSRNVRELELDADPDGHARGLVRFTPRPDDEVSIDWFQVDAVGNFATGEYGFIYPSDFCTNWQLRFLSFGGLSGGSVMTILVNGPRGAGPGAIPSVAGNVYSEAGAFINSFVIRTDEWSFQREVLDLVTGSTKFGSVELAINAISNPDGVVSVVHSALGKFSVGVQGVCKDGL